MSCSAIVLLLCGAMGQSDVMHPSKPAPLPAEDSRNWQAIQPLWPESAAEKSIAPLVFVFYKDHSRRAVPSLLVNKNGKTFGITASTSAIVPDGTPPAIDRIHVEQSDVPNVEVDYSEQASNRDLFVYATDRELTDFTLRKIARADVGSRVDAIPPASRYAVETKVANVIAIDQTFTLKRPKLEPFKHEGLLVLDKALPEGTPLFIDGLYAGVVLIGSRFGDESRSYAVPAERVKAVIDRVQP